jgi:hypothetical protein
MSKPVLLSGGNGKASELAGSVTGQVLTWSEAGEWFPGSSGGSGGGGAIFYLNSATSAASPTGNVPGGAGGATAYFAPAQTSKTFTATAQTRLAPPTGELPSDGSWAIVQGFLSTDALGLTSIPAGLWDFNLWAKASTGAGATQVQFRIKVGVYDGTNAPTILFTSDDVYIYDPTVAAQYAVSVVIGSNTISATDRLYIEIDARASANNRTATFYFGGVQPSHVHTTIVVPVNLNSNEVTGTLPVANGGTGATSLTGYVKGNGTSAFTASAAIPVADVTGAAPLASPTFTGTVTIPAGASIGGYLTTATAASTYAPLASPTFSGTPSLPTGTTGVTQSAGNSSTALATTAFVTAALAASSGTPYDLPCEIPGTPFVSTKVVNFEAVRPFILATTGHQGGQLSAPTGNFICTVRKNATTLGTITFGTSSFSTNITATLTDRTFAAGDVLSVETPPADLTIDTPFWTFFMTLA